MAKGQTNILNTKMFKDFTKLKDKHARLKMRSGATKVTKADQITEAVVEAGASYIAGRGIAEIEERYGVDARKKATVGMLAASFAAPLLIDVDSNLILKGTVRALRNVTAGNLGYEHQKDLINKRKNQADANADAAAQTQALAETSEQDRERLALRARVQELERQMMMAPVEAPVEARVEEVVEVAASRAPRFRRNKKQQAA